MPAPQRNGPVDPRSTDPVEGVPGDNTNLVAMLDSLAGEGFDANLTAVADASLRCGSCGQASRADSYDIARVRRLEGASDPDDMQMVVAATCPNCGASPFWRSVPRPARSTATWW
ncbi:hypothetical protein BH23ACT2_BH23ACT2_01360 [soil metagenome]